MNKIKILILIFNMLNLLFCFGQEQIYEKEFVRKYKVAYDSMMNLNYEKINYFIDSICKVKKIEKSSLKIKHIPKISYYENIEYPIDTAKYIYYLNPNKIKFDFLSVYDSTQEIATIYDYYSYWGTKLALSICGTDKVTSCDTNRFLNFLFFLDQQGIDTIFRVENAIYLYFVIKNSELLVLVEYKNQNGSYDYSLYRAEEYIPNNIQKHLFYTIKPSMAFKEAPKESKLKKFIKRISRKFLSLFTKINC